MIYTYILEFEMKEYFQCLAVWQFNKYLFKEHVLVLFYLASNVW